MKKLKGLNIATCRWCISVLAEDEVCGCETAEAFHQMYELGHKVTMERNDAVKRAEAAEAQIAELRDLLVKARTIHEDRAISAEEKLASCLLANQIAKDGTGIMFDQRLEANKRADKAEAQVAAMLGWALIHKINGQSGGRYTECRICYKCAVTDERVTHNDYCPLSSDAGVPLLAVVEAAKELKLCADLLDGENADISPAALKRMTKAMKANREAVRALDGGQQ